jgi:radical SAM protein with 4Fe4S-binding SPASM domain
MSTLFKSKVRENRKSQVFTSFTSNMTIMTDEIADRLVKAGHHEINISMESADPAILGDIRRGAHFNVAERILANIAKVHRAKERLGKDTPHIAVYSILMRHLVPNTRAFVDALKEAGVNALYFQDLIPNFDGSPPRVDSDQSPEAYEPITTLPKEEIREIIRGIRALADDHFEIHVPRHFEHLDGHWLPPEGILTCFDLWERPMIAVDGTVTPCCYGLRCPELNMGNIHEQHFRDIWFGKRYETLRLQHILNRHPPVCRDCYQMYQVIELPRRPLRQTPDGAPLRHTYPHIFLGKRRFRFGPMLARRILESISRRCFRPPAASRKTP